MYSDIMCVSVCAQQKTAEAPAPPAELLGIV